MFLEARKYAYQDVLKMISEIEDKASHGCYND